MWCQTSYLANFELTWKMAISLALVMAKHCSDLALLHIDIQHLFLQHHAAIFISASGYQVIFHLKFIFNLIPVLIIALYLFEGLFMLY